jgi:hypothetical protein
MTFWFLIYMYLFHAIVSVHSTQCYNETRMTSPAQQQFVPLSTKNCAENYTCVYSKYNLSVPYNNVTIPNRNGLLYTYIYKDCVLESQCESLCNKTRRQYGNKTISCYQECCYEDFCNRGNYPVKGM